MKTILVPTDFSPAANSAASFAMDIAKSIRANILLCNAILVPAEVPMAGGIVWPLADYGSLKASADHDLQSLADELRTRNHACFNQDEFNPSVDTKTELGRMIDVVNDAFEQKDGPVLSIMGMSGAGNMSRFFPGSNSKELINAAAFPVILIPASCKYSKINKIAFATDLSEGDISVINSLVSFAKFFNAEILLVHVTDTFSDAKADKKEANDFLKRVTNQINYPGIFYRHLVNNDINDGLEWLNEHGNVDMIVMVHRKHNLWYRIFEGSHTQKMAREVNIPLMVYPASSLPVF